MDQIKIKSKGKEVIDITDAIVSFLDTRSIKDGLCNIFVEHTTAAVTVSDLDPGTDKDLIDAFSNMVPDLKYRHPHDPSHVGDHIMSALVGVSLTLPFKNGKLILGTWQRVVLVDFDGPRERNINFSVIKESN